MKLARTLVAAASAALVALLSAACTTTADRDATVARLSDAIKGVDGVKTVNVWYKPGSAGNVFATGTVTLSTVDPAESTALLGQVYTAMAPILANDKGGRDFMIHIDTFDANGTLVPVTDLGFNGHPYAYQIIEKFGG